MVETFTMKYNCLQRLKLSILPPNTYSYRIKHMSYFNRLGPPEGTHQETENEKKSSRSMGFTEVQRAIYITRTEVEKKLTKKLSHPNATKKEITNIKVKNQEHFACTLSSPNCTNQPSIQEPNTNITSIITSLGKKEIPI